jgi:hypothetical protein
MFTPNIPTSGQSLGVTRVPFFNNFNTINTTISVNHVAMNDANQGKHKFLQMPTQGSAPSTAADESGVYSKKVASINNLFFAQGNRAKQYQLTTVVATSNGDSRFGTFTNYSGNNSGGWTFLPGGLILQYGKFEGLGQNPTVTFPVPFLNPSSVYSVTVTPVASSTMEFVVNTITATTFDYRLSAIPTSGAYWWAIGVPA